MSIGKIRGLQQTSSACGTFTTLALDHRQNPQKANPAFVDDAERSRFKLDERRALAKPCTDLYSAVAPFDWYMTY